MTDTLNAKEPLIVAKQLSHVYKGGKQALNNINLQIGVGLFGLLGSNGAGKSTLMRIICTLLEPTAGEVTVCGYDVVKQRDQVRNLIGYLPQEFGAWRLQTVFEVLDTLGQLSKMDKAKERKARIEEVLSLVGLTEVSKRKVRYLSGGMLRRLGVAQALLHDPKILVMDEPTVGLDPEERQRFRQLMARLATDHCVIMSTHIVTDLGSTCADMALIDAGQLLFNGSPAQLIDLTGDKVFEVSGTEEHTQQLEIEDQFEVVTRSYNNGNNILRGVSKVGMKPTGATVAENINLEEAYLAFIYDHTNQTGINLNE